MMKISQLVKGHQKSLLGKAPPVVMFSSEDPEHHLNDWLPSLKRVVLSHVVEILGSHYFAPGVHPEVTALS